MVARVRQAPGSARAYRRDRTDPAEPAMRVLLTLIPLASFATDVLAADLLPRAAPSRRGCALVHLDWPL